MIGKLKDLTFGRNGEQHITITVRSDFRESFDELKDVEVDIQIKKHHKKRSLDANGYAWVLIDKIAGVMSISKEKVYRDTIRSIGGVSETVCVKDEAVKKLRDGWECRGTGWQTETMPSKIKGCTNVILYYGSSTYDTRQMSLLIDQLIQDAQALGIETMPEDELNRLLGTGGGAK